MRPSEIGKVSVTKAVESEGIVEERDKGLGTTARNGFVLNSRGKLVSCGTKRERHRNLKHIFHRHPLALTHNPTSDTRYCDGCKKEIWGFSYSCQSCNFALHESCGEQPRELQHPLHPQHPLILRKSSLRQELCYFCNKYISRFSGFVYHCSHCDNFNLHLKCASIPFNVKAVFHDHSLKLIRKSVSFTCDACGKKEEDMYSYLCVDPTCSFLVHQKCATLPLRVKHISHPHAFDLINSSDPVNQSDRQICRLCVEKVETDRVYYCSKCNFIAHLDCATREGDAEEIKQPLESEVDESIDSLAYVVKKIKIGEDNIEIAEEIKHFSHKHVLKLTDGELLNNEKCDGCMHPIIFHPFYSCAQCKFFLHKSCVELPRKKRHPLHPHLLTLLEKAPYDSSSFMCNVCGRWPCYGFTYNCEKCWFDADVQCSLISDIFTHDGHEHGQLILSRVSYYEKCSCCDNKGKVFRCADCKFTLDLRCSTLPLNVRYRHFEQPFKLCYMAEYDSDDDYYCDICEEERESKHWFYNCAELRFPAHPDCILGKYPYLKYRDM